VATSKETNCELFDNGFLADYDFSKLGFQLLILLPKLIDSGDIVRSE
jgi:hypothetical protein